LCKCNAATGLPAYVRIVLSSHRENP
jgi:hypothetical protein